MFEFWIFFKYYFFIWTMISVLRKLWFQRRREFKDGVVHEYNDRLDVGKPSSCLNRNSWYPIWARAGLKSKSRIFPGGLFLVDWDPSDFAATSYYSSPELHHNGGKLYVFILALYLNPIFFFFFFNSEVYSPMVIFAICFEKFDYLSP